MLKTRYRKIIVLLLLLAFTSQTLAITAMSCEQEKASVNFSIEMQDGNADPTLISHTDAAMAHMHHNMGAMPNSSQKNHSQHQQEKSNCCKTMGHCLFGGCVLAAVSNSDNLLFSPANPAVEDFYSGVTPKALASSLYRPPIFC